MVHVDGAVIEYDPHRWRDHFFDLRGTMAKVITYRALVATFFAACATLVYEQKYHVEIPAVVHGLVGTALGLLLVFRTNASYDRFWEARKLWGSIVNESRNLVRSSSVLLAEEPALFARLLRWAIAFPYAVMHELRGKRGMGPIEHEVSPEDLALVRGSQHGPMTIAHQITRCLDEARREGRISDYLYASVDNNVQILIDCVGACERIKKTPLPFAYVVHLRRALTIYCGTLPFALLRDFGWGTIPVCFLVAFILFGIEEIGVEIEEPFGLDDNDLPLEQICAGIERVLREYTPRSHDE